MFVSPDILKLGFKFKQDLFYLSSTFCSQGCHQGFDRVEPFLDITSIYHYLQHKQPGRKLSKETKSLATICEEMLGVSLSKELQCSDWSHHPLTEEQKTYAAADAHCLLEIFNVFQGKAVNEAINQAGGIGLTLTAASTVISSELSWTPGEIIQVEDRVHRIGQVSSVTIYYLLANDTVDDIIWDVVQSKLENLGQMLDGHENTLEVSVYQPSSSPVPATQWTLDSLVKRCNNVDKSGHYPKLKYPRN